MARLRQQPPREQGPLQDAAGGRRRGAAYGLTRGRVGPRWSPDGSEIVFYALVPGSSAMSQIMVIPAEGGSPSALTHSAGANSYPAWSPNGLTIAFHSNRTGSMRLWFLSRASVSGPWHETGPFADCQALLGDWAPDGSGVWCDTGRDLVFVSPQDARCAGAATCADERADLLNNPRSRRRPDGRCIGNAPRRPRWGLGDSAGGWRASPGHRLRRPRAGGDLRQCRARPPLPLRRAVRERHLGGEPAW